MITLREELENLARRWREVAAESGPTVALDSAAGALELLLARRRDVELAALDSLPERAREIVADLDASSDALATAIAGVCSADDDGRRAAISRAAEAARCVGVDAMHLATVLRLRGDRGTP